CKGIYNPELTMTRLNTHLISILPQDELALCQYARYDPDQRTFTVVSAGTPPPMIYRAKNRAVQRLHVSGKPLGAFIDTNYQSKNIQLDPGDKIVFYTDGLLKAAVAGGVQYTEVRLAEMVA